jgi:hypothetical protein
LTEIVINYGWDSGWNDKKLHCVPVDKKGASLYYQTLVEAPASKCESPLNYGWDSGWNDKKLHCVPVTKAGDSLYYQTLVEAPAAKCDK